MFSQTEAPIGAFLGQLVRSDFPLPRLIHLEILSMPVATVCCWPGTLLVMEHMSSVLEEWDLRFLFVASLLIRASLRWSVPLALNESKRGTFCVFLPSFPGAANEKEANYLCKMAALLQQWQAFSALKQQYSKLKEEKRGGSEKRWSTQNVTPQPAMRLVHLMAFTSNPV